MTCNNVATQGGTRAHGRVRPACWLVSLTAMLLCSTALAQGAAPPGFELERLELNPNGIGTLGVGTGELLGQGQWRVGLLGHYQNEPLVFYVQGVRAGSVIEHRAMGHLVGAWAPLSWLELNAQVPVVLWQQGEDLSGRGVPRVGTTGLSTPLVAARAAVLSQRGEGPVDLAVELGVGLPVGSTPVFGLEPGVRLAPRVIAGRRFEGLRMGLEVAGVVRQQEGVGNELRLGAVVATTGNGLRGELSVRGALPLGRTPHASAEVLGGVRMPLAGSMEVFALGGPGIGQAPGTPTFRLLLGVAFGSPGPSSGPVCVPGVAHRPEHCPELNVDPVKDVDGDGVEDAQDACPSEAGPPERKGCPVRDSDKDGVEDDKDACPSEAGPPERKGCPVRDSDKDGVEDGKDACPSEAGPPELRGCPPKDSDGDEVVDLLDNCPTEKGVKSNQGCPAAQKQLVVIRQDRLELKAVVLFDTGKATIKRRSFDLLDQVSKVLREHPELRALDIEGHTDNVGRPEDNRRLSQARARAVKTYLTQRGVEASRLEPKGYGPDRPVASNKTTRGRAVNRRVEFIITTGEVQQ